LHFLQRRQGSPAEFRLNFVTASRRRFLHLRRGMRPDRFIRDNTIIGIFNYCTRRCEHCPFTARCTLYQSERDYEQRHPEATWQDRVHDSFAETFRLLEEWCTREGIDFAQMMRDVDTEEADAQMERADDAARSDPLQKLATAYTHAALNVMDAMATARTVRQWGASVDAALDTITWNASMISAKVHRALHGYAEREMIGGEDAIQNDWNGSAKVARILIDESRESWRVVLREGRAPEDSPLKDLLQLLEQIDAALGERFPRAMEFIRPGFDPPADTRAL
jgi:hypothetical protein